MNSSKTWKCTLRMLSMQYTSFRGTSLRSQVILIEASMHNKPFHNVYRVAVGDCNLLWDFYTRTSDLRSAFWSMEEHLHRYIVSHRFWRNNPGLWFAQFQFVGADPVDSVVKEFNMVKTIGAVANAFQTRYWEIFIGYPSEECPYSAGNWNRWYLSTLEKYAFFYSSCNRI